MEKNLLVGNEINIQFGGGENYSNSAIMTRAINNIKMAVFLKPGEKKTYKVKISMMES